MNEGLSPIFNPTKIELYESPLFPYSINPGDVVTWNHNLGFKLSDIEIKLVCVIAEGGHAAGDELELSGLNFWVTNAISQNAGFIYSVNLTSVVITLGDRIGGVSVYGLVKSTGAIFAFTAANWKWKFYGKRIIVGDIPDITTVGMVPIENKSFLNVADVKILLNINKYDSFRIDFNMCRPLTDATTLALRSSSNGGVTFDNAASSYGHKRHGAQTAGAFGVGVDSDTEIEVAAVISNNTARGFRGIFNITGAGLNSWTEFRFSGGYRTSTPEEISIDTHGVRFEEAIVNAVQFIMFSGNMDLNYTLYGIRGPA